MGEAFHSVSNIVPGDGIEVDTTDPHNPVVSASGGGGGVESVVAGDNVTVDDTDPANPIVSATGGGIESVVGGINILVDDTDPANPVVSIGPTDGEEGTFIDLQPGGDYIIVQGAVAHYLSITASFGVNIFTTKPFTVNSAVPMKPPAAANVPGTLDATLYGGGIIYDSGGFMMWSDGTQWWEFGKVVSVGAGAGIAVDNTDPANPIVSVEAPE